MLEVKFYKDGEEYKPTPIEVATMLIQAKEKRKVYKNLLLGLVVYDAENAPEEQTREIEIEMFFPSEIKEIAEYLLVYAKKKYGCPMSMQDSDGSVNGDE